MNNTISYQLTSEELYRAMQFTLRKAGNMRLWIQSAVLLVLGAICLVDYLTSSPPKPTIRLVLLVASLVLLVAQWVVPNRRFRLMADEMAAKGDTLYLSINEDGIAVGKEEQATIISLKDCREKGLLKRYPQHNMAILQLDGHQWIPIPYRILPDGQLHIIQTVSLD